MRSVNYSLMILFLPVFLYCQSDFIQQPVSTYSIVARDTVTGEIGVAVQSHFFSAGSIVPWAEAGVGAVATQSFADPRYGPLGLELMRMGRSAREALQALVSTDAGEAVRQVAMIDANGNVAVHTGGNCIYAAGHRTGNQYSVQANLMESPAVWDAMAQAYENTQGDLAERLLAALEAAEEEGGDIRGKQSAALLIVAGESSGYPWIDRIYDLRVEDHPDPVEELKRLVTLKRVYRKLNEGLTSAERADITAAMKAFQDAETILPDEATNGEVVFWAGISLASADRIDEAELYLQRAYKQNAQWAEVVRRLPASGLLPDDDGLVQTLIETMKR